MNRLLFIALAVALPFSAQAKSSPKPKAPPVVATAPEFPLPAPDAATIETSTGSVPVTTEQKAEIDFWLTDLQKQKNESKATIAHQQQELDAAETDARESRAKAAISESKDKEANERNATLQNAIDAQAKQLGTTIDALNKSIIQTAKYKAESDKRGNVIGWACGLALSLLAWGLILKFGAIIPIQSKLMAEIAVPTLAFPVGYLVARWLV